MTTTIIPPSPTGLDRAPNRHTSTHHGHRPFHPQQLHRPVPIRTWDPLAIDAEGPLPVDSDLSLVLPAAPPAPPPSEMGRIASIITKAVAEVLLGSRSVLQVQPWLCEDVWLALQRRADLRRRSSHRVYEVSSVKIVRVHPCQIDDRTCEVSVVLHDGRRVRAAALRLALHRDRWRAAAVRIG